MKKLLKCFSFFFFALLIGLIILNVENNFQYNKKINNMEEKIKNIKKENDSLQNKKNKIQNEYDELEENKEKEIEEYKKWQLKVEKLKELL